ncbi:Glycosyltransferase, probably involved in cell wall biogenesis [Shewanella piezotolerans WP3]|uniref:Glycosyltransferase, probably involved in cell wall biogenesis n=1 Tax=Shewanella piezotolerans (strain WP3 / JCM 13877) TaxID=225849 RepID=B8CLZ3_SHEPW|nr:cellulose synthase catalytic subunit [Shewanella piezotolerans]ACJ28917.1 Glycosyltransferase, probably involved in cell wall biogenesis [Shewanella piezotolerans WP3]
MDFYFSEFEKRTPPQPASYSASRELLYQYLATCNIALGIWYLVWRWGFALNYDAMWFSLPLAFAESCAFVGSVLFAFNLWKTSDEPIKSPPATINECINEPMDDRPIGVDIMFPTYDEEPELVALSIRDALNVRYPHEIETRIFILDDGRRPEMAQLAADMGVEYITRDNNVGYKAGNLRNALEQTYGDFIVICDADTRPFPSILENTLGYFKDPDVAWVQTPQWFFDLPAGERLPAWLKKRLGTPISWLGSAFEKIYGPVTLGRDPYANDPQMFYDVIQRRRNWANASFCCGAGSIHRREAVMEAALRSYSQQISKEHEEVEKQIRKLTKEKSVDKNISANLRQEIIFDTEFTPYKFHVSEDIYTSLILHGDTEREWRSIQHPQIESKMLSPQDLQSWTVQRFKYSGGSIDIFMNDNPLFKKGMSLKQKLMYGASFWSNLSAIWNIIFLACPIVYFLTSIAPVSAYDTTFYMHFLPFVITAELAMMVGTWGVAGYQGKTNFLSFFPVNLRALWTVLRGKKISFPTTPKSRQQGLFLHLVIPQIAVFALSLGSMAFAWYAYSSGSFGSYSLGGLILNSFWTINNMMAMWGMIAAACWSPPADDVPTTVETTKELDYGIE